MRTYTCGFCNRSFPTLREWTLHKQEAQYDYSGIIKKPSYSKGFGR